RHRVANRRVAQLTDKLRQAPAGPTQEARLVLPELARQVARRDRYTRAHPGRVQRVSAEVAHHVGLPAGECALAGLAGLLRDIGTLEIPTAILDRPGPLEPDEAAFVRHHPRLGASLLAPYFEGEV